MPGTFAEPGVATPNHFLFNGKLCSRKPAKASYELVATPSAGGHREGACRLGSPARAATSGSSTPQNHPNANREAGVAQATIRMRQRASGLPVGKTFDAWEPERSAIPSSAQRALRTLEWIDRAEVLCVCGPSGTGKSHFVEPLGHLAIGKGKTVAWHTLETLAQLLRRHRADDSINNAIGNLIRSDLVVIDDVGLLPVSADAAEALFRIIDAAYEKRSIAISSNIHPSKAHRFA
jgi:DNA replication protein DnaC